MTDYTGYGLTRARARSYPALLGQVMFLVAVALGFLALGTYLGRDLAIGTARVISFVGLGMLLVASFGGERFRIGSFAMGWLFGTALAIGIGLGPVLAYLVENDPTVVTQAAGATALIVVGMGAAGFFLSKDLARWMRPLSLIVFGAVIVSFVMVLFASGGNPVLSVIIGGVSTRIASPDTMRAQREHIARLAETLTTATIAIVPFTAQAPIATLHGWSLTDDLATIETDAGNLEIADPQHVERYWHNTRLLLDAAATGTGAATLCRQISSQTATTPADR
jgi:FtsH-binding integral membrane protein